MRGISNRYGTVAQLVEHSAFNRQVAGSSPAGSTQIIIDPCQHTITSAKFAKKNSRRFSLLKTNLVQSVRFAASRVTNASFLVEQDLC